MRIFILGFAIPLLFVASCSSESTDYSDNGHFDQDTTVIAFTNFSVSNHDEIQVIEPSTQVFMEETDFAGFWELHRAPRFPTRPVPSVDFTDSMVLGVFWGDSCKYSGGGNFADAILSIVSYNDTIFVEIGDPKVGVFGACIEPCHLATTKKSTKPVKFVGKLPE